MMKESSEIHGKLEPYVRENSVVRKNYEERVTYRTITRSEFQKRRASFENKDEMCYEKTVEIVKGKDDGEKKLGKRTRSMDELSVWVRGDDPDPYQIQSQERDMANKLEDIHRMIRDMQELTRQLKERKESPEYKGNKYVAHSGTAITSDNKSENENKNGTLLLKSVPIRYKSTILIVIGSSWQRYKEEIELRVTP